MGLLTGLAAVASAANVVLLAALAGIWGRNYRRFRSKHTLGMLVFAVLLLVENAVALYFYVWDPFMATWYRDPARVPTGAMRGLLLLDVLETGAVAFLVWITVD